MKTKLLLSWILVLAASSASLVFGQQNRTDRIVASLAEKLRAAKIESGLIVTTVATGFVAERVGVREGDLIVKINDQAVTDTASFAAVRDRLAGTQVRFTLWRDGAYVTTPPTFLPATAGLTGVDWSYPMSQILLAIDKDDRTAASALFTQADASNALSRKNWLIAKLLILPSVPPTGDSEQGRLTDELLTVVTKAEGPTVATMLRSHDRPWPSIALQRKMVAEQPENVNLRLNLADILARQKLSEEAESNVKYLLDRPRPGLSPYGFSVAEEVLEVLAGNRGQWIEAYTHDLKAFEYNSNFADEEAAAHAGLHHVYVASRLTDIAVFKEARAFALRLGGPAFEQWLAHVDALEAHVLFKNGHEVEARRLVSRWTQKPEWQKVYDYWLPLYPECADTWKLLAKP